MGLSLALAPRTRRHGAILAASSLAYFFLATKVILPLVNGSGYFCTGYYPHLGSSISEIVVSPLVRPRAFWGTLLEPATFGLLFGLLAPWLLLPLAKPRWLLAAAPVLAFACLRTDIFFKSITHWHHTNVFAWIFLALVDSARSPHAAWVLGIRCRGRARARALAGGALGAAVFGALLYGDEPFGKTRRPFSPRPGQGAIVRELASSFPKDAQIVATERAAAHVVPEHPDVRILRPDLERGADLVYLLDLQDSWGLPSIPRLRKDMKVLRRDGYGVARSRGNFVVLEKGAPRASATDIVDAPPGPPVARFEEAGLTLLSISRLSEDRARLIWRVDRKTEGDWFLVPTRPGARPDIDDLAGDFYAIGPATRPTYERAEGEAFSEERILEIPEKEPLRLHVFDFLEVDARGERMGEVIARCRLRAVRRK